MICFQLDRRLPEVEFGNPMDSTQLKLLHYFHSKECPPSRAQLLDVVPFLIKNRKPDIIKIRIGKNLKVMLLSITHFPESSLCSSYYYFVSSIFMYGSSTFREDVLCELSG